jgi:hypothetical protein
MMTPNQNTGTNKNKPKDFKSVREKKKTMGITP